MPSIQLNEFLERTSIRVSDAALQDMQESPHVIELVKELGSLGIVCRVLYECAVQIFVSDNFVLPQDLSEKSEVAINAMFSAEDRELLRSMQIGELNDKA
jgi:hypothetical protein